MGTGKSKISKKHRTPRAGQKAIRTETLRALKAAGEKFAVMTAYDYPTARAVSESGIEVILVGDSLGMVVLGESSTLSVTLDAMIHHCRAVVKGAGNCLVVADMPFLSYQVSPAEALRHAGRLIKESGAQAVKLEGGSEILPAVSFLRKAGVAVMGHLGLTPQSVHALGGYRIQGKRSQDAARLLRDAKALEKAGCFAVVLELVPGALARKIAAALKIPVIGIGAGPKCDGQVLVAHDALGLSPDFRPRHARAYEQIYRRMVQAFSAYRRDVKSGAFPAGRETPG